MGVKIDDLAAMANTSTATVSRALNNKPGVKDATRQRILTLADKLGYRPNRIARNLALQKSHVIGFIAADLFNPVYIDFFRHVQRGVEPLGYQVLILDSEQSVEKEKQNIEVLRQHQAEGLLIFPVHDWDTRTPVDHLVDLRLRKFPFVIVGAVKGQTFDSITTDEVGTARKLAKHLTDLGHRRIGFVGFDPNNRCIAERYDGLHHAVREHGGTIATDHVVNLGEGWTDRVTEILRKPGRPTALVFVNDVCALLSHRPILELGLEIPRDLSVVTFDNGLWTRHLKPSLTATAESTAEVARVAMDFLLQRIEDPDGTLVQTRVSQDLIIRESTGPCHAA